MPLERKINLFGVCKQSPFGGLHFPCIQQTECILNAFKVKKHFPIRFGIFYKTSLQEKSACNFASKESYNQIRSSIQFKKTSIDRICSKKVYLGNSFYIGFQDIYILLSIDKRVLKFRRSISKSDFFYTNKLIFIGDRFCLILFQWV